VALSPLEASAEPDTFLAVANAAVSTSGDAFQFVAIDGVRYSHIVDPHTGIGLRQSSAVTVIARDGMTADSLATACSVLGAQKAIALVEELPETECRLVYLEGRDVRTVASQDFAKYLAPDSR
jgi:thiamine biosynthesis lipoprotein